MLAICTSYNVIEDSSTITGKRLELRNNWVDEIIDDDHFVEFCQKFGIKITPDTSLRSYYFNNNVVGYINVSEPLEGKMELPNVELHVRFIS